jgi:type II secretory pathway component PulF
VTEAARGLAAEGADAVLLGGAALAGMGGRIQNEVPVPLVDGIALAGEAKGNRWLADRVGEAAGRVRQGQAPSVALESVSELAPHLVEWLRVGEAGGCLDAMLDVPALRAQAAWDRSVARVLALFEPVVLVCVGAFVLAVALAILLPVTALTRGIG